MTTTKPGIGALVEMFDLLPDEAVTLLRMVEQGGMDQVTAALSDELVTMAVRELRKGDRGWSGQGTGADSLEARALSAEWSARRAAWQAVRFRFDPPTRWDDEVAQVVTALGWADLARRYRETAEKIARDFVETEDRQQTEELILTDESWHLGLRRAGAALKDRLRERWA